MSGDPTDQYEPLTPYGGAPLAAAGRGRRVLGVVAALVVAAVAVVWVTTRDDEPGRLVSAGPTVTARPRITEPVYTPPPSMPPSTSPAPPPTPPVPKPVRLAGNGSRTVAFSWPETYALVYATVPDGEMSSAVQHDADDFATGGGAWMFRSGVYVMVVDPDATKLKITSRGRWTLELRSPRTAPEGRSRMSGRANAVFWYRGGDTIAVATGSFPNDYQRQTTVYRVERERVRQTMRPWGDPPRDRKRWAAGPVLVWVDSGGPWSITFQ